MYACVYLCNWTNIPFICRTCQHYQPHGALHIYKYTKRQNIVHAPNFSMALSTSGVIPRRNIRPICVRSQYFGRYASNKHRRWRISEATYLNFDLSIHLHLYFAYANSEESREYKRRLVRAMAALWCYNGHRRNLKHWPIDVLNGVSGLEDA